MGFAGWFLVGFAVLYANGALSYVAAYGRGGKTEVQSANECWWTAACGFFLAALSAYAAWTLVR